MPGADANFTEAIWVDFVVCSENPYQFHVERIPQNDNMWLTSVLPKLKSFYFSASGVSDSSSQQVSRNPRTSNKMGIFESYNLYFIILNIFYI